MRAVDETHTCACKIVVNQRGINPIQRAVELYEPYNLHRKFSSVLCSFSYVKGCGCNSPTSTIFPFPPFFKYASKSVPEKAHGCIFFTTYFLISLFPSLFVSLPHSTLPSLPSPVSPKPPSNPHLLPPNAKTNKNQLTSSPFPGANSSNSSASSVSGVNSGAPGGVCWTT